MADEIDVMQEVEQRLLDERIKQATCKDSLHVPDPWCEDCGEEIPAKRRTALPFTTVCVDCATLREIKESKR